MKKRIEDFPLINKDSLLSLLSPAEGRIFFELGTRCLVDKPAGWTSFDVVNKLRFSCRAKRVGHAGTLDPFATGLLVVCTGQATKTLAQLTDMDKEYEGTICLGLTTSTDDIEGEIMEKTEVPTGLDRRALQEYCFRLVGNFDQIPPIYSAVKIAGVPAYKRARRGENPEMKPRPVRVDEFKVMEANLPLFSFRIVCSKGTYVRSLARDLGSLIGCGAHVASLRRVRVSNYLASDAATPEAISNWMKLTLAVA